MAPEIIQNQKYDAKANLWSVGAILFQLVTGKPPFEGNCQYQVVQKEREEKLAEILKDRLNQYVQGNKDAFISQAEAEVSRLSNADNLPLTI
ncbi:serine/threonine-protein kinase ATG1a-like isoform X2 [Magnolia sinica]|uniref:serine/threonine-protein kinase ATG1a-like isoform X2 n=1 Tax=Magnolia sinica TaxID=86752 RepID=UPI00265AE0C8|nr:serine/threonine-protein kinase ATG1a-like isoform X2 [Magnolia sinica]